MKILSKILIVSTITATVLSANASDLYTKIAEMKKGTDGYIIGQVLTKEQQVKASAETIKSDNPKIKKFLDGKNLLIAINSQNNRVLAINKRYEQLPQKDVKGMIGTMIHDFDEPTAMAHDKMIYWIYDENGKKLSEDDLKAWKDKISGKPTEGMALAEAVNVKKKEVNFNPFVSVKLQSDQPMMTELEEVKLANTYLMISSDKLIKETTGIK